MEEDSEQPLPIPTSDLTVMKSTSLSDRLNAIWFHQIWVSFDLWEVLEMGLWWI
jgi:hypothetical protein